MRINCFILCDDIRTEVGNKKSLMGVYSKEIAFSVAKEEKKQWPKEIVLGLMLDFSVNRDTKEKAKGFEICYQLNDMKRSIGKGTFQFTKDEVTRKDDIQAVIYMKAHYIFDSPGFLFHLVEVFDESGEVIAQATIPTRILIKEVDL